MRRRWPGILCCHRLLASSVARFISGFVVAAIVVLSAVSCPAIAASVLLPVPRITLYPGDSIRSDHLVERTFYEPSTRRSAVYRTQDQLIGKVVRRTLLPGKPIPVNAVRDPYLVVQGHTVQIVFQDGPLVITGYAVAIQSGGKGDIVRVRNVDSGVIVDGAVQPDGTVRVNP